MEWVSVFQQSQHLSSSDSLLLETCLYNQESEHVLVKNPHILQNLLHLINCKLIKLIVRNIYYLFGERKIPFLFSFFMGKEIYYSDEKHKDKK